MKLDKKLARGIQKLRDQMSGKIPPDPVVVVDNQDPETKPDWTKKCENCGQTPIVPITGLCGPCTFGEADTIGGNW